MPVSWADWVRFMCDTSARPDWLSPKHGHLFYQNDSLPVIFMSALCDTGTFW